MVNAFLSVSAGACDSPSRCAHAPRRHSSCGSIHSDYRSSGYDSVNNSFFLHRVAADFDDDGELLMPPGCNQLMDRIPSDFDHDIDQLFKPCGSGMSWVLLAEEAAAKAQPVRDDALSNPPYHLHETSCNRGTAGDEVITTTAMGQWSPSLDFRLNQVQLQHQEQHQWNHLLTNGQLADTHAAPAFTPPVPAPAPPADPSRCCWPLPRPSPPLPPPPAAPAHVVARPRCTTAGPAPPGSPHHHRHHHRRRFDATCYAAPPPPLGRHRFWPEPIQPTAAAAKPSVPNFSPPAIPVPLSFGSSQPPTPPTTAHAPAGRSPVGSSRCRGAAAGGDGGRQQAAEAEAEAPCRPRDPRDNKMLCAVMRYYDTVRQERSRRPPGKPAEPQRVVHGFDLHW